MRRHARAMLSHYVQIRAVNSENELVFANMIIIIMDNLHEYAWPERTIYMQTHNQKVHYSKTLVPSVSRPRGNMRYCHSSAVDPAVTTREPPIAGISKRAYTVLGFSRTGDPRTSREAAQESSRMTARIAGKRSRQGLQALSASPRQALTFHDEI